MQIQFSPIRADADLSLSRAGDTLIINALEYDFSGLGAGDRLPRAAVATPAVISDVTRDGDGVLHLTLALPHGPDAPEDVRFPAGVVLEDGPCRAPGLMQHEGVAFVGRIDWSQMITASQAEGEARAAWRADRRVAKPDLLLALYSAGLISEASAMGLAVPAEFEAAIADLPDPPRAEIRIRWAHLVEVPRMHPLILTVQAALKWTDEAVDALFGWGADHG